MTQEDIIKLAREAGLADSNGVVHAFYQLERLAALAFAAGADAEREACAKVCEEITNELSNWPAAYDVVTAETKQDSTAIWQAIGKPFVEAIRARGSP